MRYLLLIPLLACSFADAPENDIDPSDSGTPTNDTGEPPVVEEGWASFDGEVVIEDGSALSTSITLGLWEKDPVGQPSLTCSVLLESTTPAPANPPADPIEPYTMWQTSTVNSTCLGTPDQVALGIGPLPVELWPAAEFEGVSVRQARGLYTVWDGSLVVFGLAGTTRQLEGRGEPTSLDPLPDGTYQLVSAYLLEI